VVSSLLTSLPELDSRDETVEAGAILVSRDRRAVIGGDLPGSHSGPSLFHPSEGRDWGEKKNQEIPNPKAKPNPQAKKGSVKRKGKRGREARNAKLVSKGKILVEKGRGHAAGFISLGVLLPGALVHVWVAGARPLWV
jgi:hypothetical protein